MISLNALNEAKVASESDPLLLEIQSAANTTVYLVDQETQSVESVDYQSAWFSLMKNMTRDYFNESECEDFKDCIFYSISIKVFAILYFVIKLLIK